MKPIFLDWDGVLIDSLNIYLDLFVDLCQEWGKTLPIADAKGFRDWYQPNWEINFAELGFTEEEYQKICAEYPDVLDYNKAPLFEGVTKMVSELSKTNPLVVVSTAPTANIEKRLKEAGLREHFAAVTGSDDGSTDKTARLQKLQERFGTGGLMVGDTDLDVKSGREAGLVTVGVTYGWLSAERVEDSKPNFLVSKPEELQATVQQALN